MGVLSFLWRIVVVVAMTVFALVLLLVVLAWWGAQSITGASSRTLPRDPHADWVRKQERCQDPRSGDPGSGR